MKKITLLAGALLVSLASFAQITLTHSVDPVTVDNGIVCDNAAPSSINSFRAYDLASFGVVTDFQVTSVEWGFSTLVGAVDYPVTLTLSTADTEDLTAVTLTEIATTTVVVQEADNAVLISTPLEVLVPAGSILVFTVGYPNDGVTIPAAGANLNGQTAPSYANGDCLADITDIFDFNLNQSWTMNVIGDEILGTDDVALAAVSVFPNPASDVLNIDVPASVELKGATLYDVLGKATNVSLSNGQINVSSLSRGVYILNVDTSAGTLTEKVIIE